MACFSIDCSPSYVDSLCSKRVKKLERNSFLFYSTDSITTIVDMRKSCHVFISFCHVYLMAVSLLFLIRSNLAT